MTKSSYYNKPDEPVDVPGTTQKDDLRYSISGQ